MSEERKKGRKKEGKKERLLICGAILAAVALVAFFVFANRGKSGEAIMKALEDNGYDTYYQVNSYGNTYDKNGNCIDLGGNSDFKKIDCKREKKNENSENEKYYSVYNIAIIKNYKNIFFTIGQNPLLGLSTSDMEDKNEKNFTAIRGDASNYIFYWVREKDGKQKRYGGVMGSSSSSSDICFVDLGDGLPYMGSEFSKNIDECSKSERSGFEDFNEDLQSLLKRLELSENDLFEYDEYIFENYIKPKREEIDNSTVSILDIGIELNKAGYTVKRKDDNVVLSGNSSHGGTTSIEMTFIPDNNKKIKMIEYRESRYHNRCYTTYNANDDIFEDKGTTSSGCSSSQSVIMSSPMNLWNLKLVATQDEIFRYVESKF